MTEGQKWSITVGTSGLLVVVAAFLQWFSKEGESISGIEFAELFFVVPAGLVAVGAIATFVYQKRPPLLARIAFFSLYGLMGLMVYVLPVAAMDPRYTFRGPGIPLTVLAVSVGGLSSFVWLVRSSA